MDYAPTERKGKGKLRARDGFYGEYGPMDAEEGEVREQSARYGPPVDDRGWYGEGHYPSYPNNMPSERTRKRSYPGMIDTLSFQILADRTFPLFQLTMMRSMVGHRRREDGIQQFLVYHHHLDGDLTFFLH